MHTRADSALTIAYQFGQVDGSHHKAWVIDQMVRVLVGPERYEEWVRDYQSGSDGPDTFEWDVGIAP